ncbi:MAG: double-strand break repair protein AddB [Paracoccaceae bacterium]|nr:double-strand break repair protein AddB [Paracoccaceae bacterium]
MTDARLFAVPLGAPYPAAFAEGFHARFGALKPAEIARITIYANTRRMAGAIAEALAARAPCLLPRIRTIADLGLEPAALTVPPPVDALRLRLELSHLTRELLSNDPTIAPVDAAFDIAGSLLRVLGEMAGEGVSVERLRDLDLADHSAHWTRSLGFIDLVSRYLDLRGGALEAEAQQRAVVEAVTNRWQEAPPGNPVVVAGSTGSRGTTRILMEAVARSHLGHVVLPGFDTTLPAPIWDSLGEGHPQYRFRALFEALALRPDDVEAWAGVQSDPDRGRVLSLALRPPPVTDQWRSEGAALPGLSGALAKVSLVEAPGPRVEAVAIALGMRDAVDRGLRVALVTPDRVLTRRIAAALTRWGIEPDDSAGRPLALSAPGRLLRQVAPCLTEVPDAGVLLALLKHPLVATGGDRGPHLLHTRELELWLRRRGAPLTGAETLHIWAGQDPGRIAWTQWLAPLLAPLAARPETLVEWLSALVRRTEAFAAGPGRRPSEELWAGPPGEAARQALDALTDAAPNAGPVTPREAARILDGVLQDEVRDPVLPHADVMIRGTIEVRALEADLVILAGLNDGVWPPAPEPDPWLNRALRRQAGLLSPERRTGLSAHDFEMGFHAPEVWISRTLRDDEGETVPSRWLNRLIGLVGGLDATGGPETLKEMRARGRRWVRLAEGLDRRARTEPPAARPAPRPPEDHRPRTLTVTEIQKLIRDPYAIYARRILGLRALPAPVHTADARLRGDVLHKIVERFVKAGVTGDPTPDRAEFLAIAKEALAAEVPWPVTRTLWLARLDRIADGLLAGEYDRQSVGRPAAFETAGMMTLDQPSFTLVGKADRIDRRGDGLAIYDYKSGRLPTAKEIRFFDRQLLLEAVMVEAGAFEVLGAATAAEIGHIGLGASADVRRYALDGSGEPGFETETVLAEFRRLIAAYLSSEQGFAARRAMETVRYEGDYDHLARYGEWDDTMPPVPEDMA